MFHSCRAIQAQTIPRVYYFVKGGKLCAIEAVMLWELSVLGTGVFSWVIIVINGSSEGFMC